MIARLLHKLAADVWDIADLSDRRHWDEAALLSLRVSAALDRLADRLEGVPR